MSTRLLADVATVVMGLSPKGNHVGPDPSGGIPLLNGPTEFGDRYPTPCQWTTSAPRMSKAGDILFCVRGSTTGRTNRSQVEYAIGRGLAAIRGETQSDTDFIYYSIRAGLPRLLSLTSGSVFPNLSSGDIRGFELTWPHEKARKEIAATLGVLDDKIESNQRAVETLERLGAAILEEVLKLDVYGFPDYRSDLRMGDVVSLLETGSRPKGGVSTEGQGVVSLGAESIQSAGFTSTTRFKKVPREFFERMRRGRLTDGDILIYKDGGSPGNFVPHISAFGYGFPVEEAAINEHVYRARGSDEVSQGLLYWLLRSPWMDGEMRKRGTGVAIPGLNSTNFRDLPWPVMAPHVQRGMNGALNPMLVLMLRLGAENRRIASLRDVLLPELLSGRIRVPVEGAQA